MKKSKYINVADFLNFDVEYDSGRCCACDVKPPRTPAPITINGNAYCLWCALEIAHGIIARSGGKRVLDPKVR